MPAAGARADTGLGLPNKANHIPFALPGALSVLTFVGFNQNRSKGGGCSFAGEQRVSVPFLPSLLSCVLHSEPWESENWAKGTLFRLLGWQNLTLSSCSSRKQNHTSLRPCTCRGWDPPSGDSNPKPVHPVTIRSHHRRARSVLHAFAIPAPFFPPEMHYGPMPRYAGCVKVDGDDSQS